MLTIKEIIEMNIYDYGYVEYSSIREDDEKICLVFDIDNQFCDASIIYDMSGILQDIVCDICSETNITPTSDIYDLPLIKAHEREIEVIFRKEDFQQLVK